MGYTFSAHYLIVIYSSGLKRLDCNLSTFHRDSTRQICENNTLVKYFTNTCLIDSGTLQIRLAISSLGEELHCLGNDTDNYVS